MFTWLELARRLVPSTKEHLLFTNNLNLSSISYSKKESLEKWQKVNEKKKKNFKKKRER